MNAYFRFILRHRALVLGVCVIVTILAGLALSRAVVASSLGELILGDMPEYQRYMERVAVFGGDEQLIVTLPETDPSAVDGPRLAHIVEAIKAVPDVARVQSVLDLFTTFQDAIVPPTIDLPRLAEHNPIAGTFLVARDGRGHALIVELDPDPGRGLERVPAIAGDVLDALATEGIDPDDVHLGGMLAALAETHTQTVRAMATTMPLVTLVLLGATLLLFRRLLPVFITLLVGTLAIIWTMGLAIAIDRNVNLLIAIAPALILLIAFSDVVHLCSAYLLELAAGKSREDAIMAAATEVGPACLLTSITTFLGFIGLTFIDVPGIRRMGLIVGAGVAIALLLAMTLAPILFSLLRPPKPWRHGAASGSRFDRGLGGLRRLATHRPWLVIAGFAVVAVVSVWGTMRIRVETDFVKRMPAGSRLRVDTVYLQEHFAGANLMDVFVQIDDSHTNYEALAEFHDAVEAIAGVGGVLSAVTVARADGGIANSMTAGWMSEQLRLSNPAAHLQRFVVVLEPTGFVETARIGEAIIAAGATHLGETTPVEPSGLNYLAGRWLDVHIVSQRQALAITFAFIALMMAVGFRSLRTGLASMLPNLFPLLVLGGVLGFAWRVVDSDVAVVAVIAIGIAVDDTIHFLSRYRREIARGADVDTAMRSTFSFAGRAIVITSLIFAAGFLPFTLSGYLPMRMIGVLMPLTMLTALVADLLLLPALIRVGIVRVR